MRIVILREKSMFPVLSHMPITYGCCLLIAAVSIIGFYYKPLFRDLIFHPFEFFRGKRQHTILTSGLIHNSWWHLAMNIYFFYRANRDIEYIILENHFSVLAISCISIFTIISGIIVPNYIVGSWKKSELAFTSVGFSGAVFSTLGFSLLYLPIDHPAKPFKFVPMYYAYEFAIVLAIVLVGLFITFRRTATNHAVHLLGLFNGFIIAILLRPELVRELSSHIYARVI